MTTFFFYIVSLTPLFICTLQGMRQLFHRSAGPPVKNALKTTVGINHPMFPNFFILQIFLQFLCPSDSFCTKTRCHFKTNPRLSRCRYIILLKCRVTKRRITLSFYRNFKLVRNVFFMSNFPPKRDAACLRQQT